MVTLKHGYTRGDHTPQLHKFHTAYHTKHPQDVEIIKARSSQSEGMDSSPQLAVCLANTFLQALHS